MTEMTAQEIQSELQQYYGTDQYYKHSLNRTIVYTDGVRAMAILCKAYWLIDEIALNQKGLKNDPDLKYQQFWKLQVKDHKAVLICERDKDDVVFKKEISYTDFPLEEMVIYVKLCDENMWCILLPTED